MILYGLAIIFRGEEGFWINELRRAGAVLFGFGIIHLLGLPKWQVKPRPENVLITVLILLLLADPQTTILKMIVLGLVTAIIKTVARVAHEPVFNPAAAGLLTATFLGVTTTWWGVSFSPRLPIFNMSVAALLTIPVGICLLSLYKKIPTLISVPVSLAISYFVFAGRLPFVILFEGTFAFFLMIMASEPKTTPVIDWQEWLYGILLGGMLGFLFVNRLVGQPHLVSLLSMNLLFAGFHFFYSRSLIR